MNKFRASKAAQQLSRIIEEERRKIGELSFENLSSPDAIKRMGKLERLINEYTLKAYTDKEPSWRSPRR